MGISGSHMKRHTATIQTGMLVKQSQSSPQPRLRQIYLLYQVMEELGKYSIVKDNVGETNGCEATT